MPERKIRADRGANKSSGSSPLDRETLIASTTAAKQRLRIFDRESWPAAERSNEPAHISVVIADWLAMYGLAAQRRSACRG